MENIEMDLSALPILIGTEKQISWATKIRLSMIREIERYTEMYKEVRANKQRAGLDVTHMWTPQVLNRTFYRILDKNEAKWWIEHQSDSPQLLFHKIIEGKQ